MALKIYKTFQPRSGQRNEPTVVDGFRRFSTVFDGFRRFLTVFAIYQLF